MIEQAKYIFLLGIKGVAMTNLAFILKKMGKDVSGVDIEEEFITDEWLKKEKIPYSIGFDLKNLPTETDLVVYSAAHGGSANPILQEAKKRKIKTVDQATLLAELISQFKTKIAVCGSHGKTTTTAFLAYALIELGAEPSYLVGSSEFNHMQAGDFRGRDYFVLEADEYAVDPPKNNTPKFQYLSPDLILCTNIDFDHPDVFQDLEQVKEEFAKFFQKGKKIIACIDDPVLAGVISSLPKETVLTYGESQNADVQLLTIQPNEFGMQFEIQKKEEPLGVFQIELYGEKNALNAGAVITTLLELGFQEDNIRKAVRGFTGAKRRLEKKAFVNDIYLFDDYAHHPVEIGSSIEALRKRFPGKRVILIFQSHTYSRTKALLPEFAEALALADYTIIAPIFPSARENPSEFQVSSQDIADEARRKGASTVEALETRQEILKKLATMIQQGDVVCTMGAGDIYHLADDIISLLEKAK